MNLDKKFILLIVFDYLLFFVVFFVAEPDYEHIESVKITIRIRGKQVRDFEQVHFYNDGMVGFY